ncbi:MAG: hypothetical protein H6923_01105 [Alphaproteobacteria bacterium]|nr:hypothetical protein [Alphaproteobacteria bacterium]
MSMELVAIAFAGAALVGFLGYRLWRRRPAVRPLADVVGRYRRMARRSPRRFAPGLAISLHELSLELMAAGERRAALVAVQEAVDILRVLARSEPKRFAGQLTESLALETSLLTQMGLPAGEVVREVGLAHFLGETEGRPLADAIALHGWGIAFLVLALACAMLAYVGVTTGAFG